MAPSHHSQRSRTRTRRLTLGSLRSSDSGTILIASLSLTMVLSALAAAFLSVAQQESTEHGRAVEQVRAFYVAEAGLSDAVSRVRVGLDPVIGTALSPATFGGGDYWVEAMLVGDGHVQLRCRATLGGGRACLEATLIPRGSGADPNSRKFGRAVFGDAGVNIGGTALIDSFSRSQGSYASQASPTPSGKLKADDNGSVVSNGPVHVNGLAEISGDVVSGPTATVSLSPSSLVDGATSPSDALEPLSPVVLPADLPAVFPLPIILGMGTIPVPSGTRHYSSINVFGSATVQITGPATIVCDKLNIQGNARIEVDTANGPVYFYVIDSFTVSGMPVIGSGVVRSDDLFFFIQTDNCTGFDPATGGDPARPVSMAGGLMEGALYAPNAAVQMSGNSEIFGTVIGRYVSISEEAKVHFDEDLPLSPRLPTGVGSVAPLLDLSSTVEGVVQGVMIGEQVADLRVIAWRRLPWGTEDLDPFGGLGDFPGGDPGYPVLMGEEPPLAALELPSGQPPVSASKDPAAASSAK